MTDVVDIFCTNYFRVKDEKVFLDWVKKHPLAVTIKTVVPNDDKKKEETETFYRLKPTTPDGFWPSVEFGENMKETILQFLAPGEFAYSMKTTDEDYTP